MRRLLLAKKALTIVSLTALLGLWALAFAEENQRSSEVELQQNSADALQTSGTDASLKLALSNVTLELMPVGIPKMEQAFRAAGLTVERINLPPKRSTLMAASGEIDGLFVRLQQYEDLYPTLTKVDVPVYTGLARIWVNATTECPESPSGLKDLSTVYVLGYSSYFHIAEIALSPKIQVANFTQAFRMLLAGRADFLVAYQAVAEYFQEKLNLSIKACFEEPLMRLDYYTFLHQKHRHLVPKLEREYRKVFTRVVAQ